MKTLLLGTAAALLTLASPALAADLPMTKADPVEYVRICSEFGEGFYYIPGTDTCLSINGYVRADYWWFEPDSRADDGLSFRGRGRVNFDARTATEWGTLRSFVSFEYNRSHPTGNGVRADKAFIQFGGWTAGYATSFYDFYDAEAGNTMYGTYFSSSATTHLLAYTAVFGDGFAATLSVEDNYYRRSGIDFTDPQALYGGQRAPDVVASLRWTQGWGSAQIMAAAHQTRTDFVNPIFDDELWGWAVGAGVIFNLPSGFFFALEGNYARGAAAYTGLGDGLLSDVNDIVTADPIVGDLGRVRTWSITGDLGYNFTPSLVGHLVVSHADLENTNFFEAFDFDTTAVTANLTYTIVKNLTIAGEVSWETRDYDDSVVDAAFGYDTWSAGMRLKRNF